MDVYRLLMSCREAGLRLQRMNEERSMCYSSILASGSQDGMPHAKGPKSSSVESLAVRLADLDAKLEQERSCYRSLCDEALRLIALCGEERTRKLLTARFVDCMSWSAAARYAGYSDRCSAMRAARVAVEYIQLKIDGVSRENP